MPLPKAEGGKADVQLSAMSGKNCNGLSSNQRGPGIMGPTCEKAANAEGCLHWGHLVSWSPKCRRVAACRWLF